jgi:predicted transposase/invertase (TIGR01784 family)
MIVNQLKTGDSYGKLNKVVSIMIAKHNLISDSENYIHRYVLQDRSDGSTFTDLISFVIIELPKLIDESDGTLAWQWAKFFDSKTEDDMRAIAKQNEHIEKAVETLVEVSMDDEMVHQAIREDMMRRDWISGIEGAREEGLLKGREEGREEGGKATAIASATRMKADGIETALISKYTGLSAAEIMKL